MGPKGAGKTTVVDNLLAKYPTNFQVVREHTTQAGSDLTKFIIVTKEEFEQLVDSEKMFTYKADKKTGEMVGTCIKTATDVMS